jgi:toxin ParE1/3/4
MRWTEPAAADLTGICDHIEEHSGAERARRVALAVYESADSLGRFPQRGRRGRKPGTRELVMAGLPYLVIYRIRGDVIEIARILHGAQRWP